MPDVPIFFFFWLEGGGGREGCAVTCQTSYFLFLCGGGGERGSMPTHIFVWGYMYPQRLAFGGTS